MSKLKVGGQAVIEGVMMRSPHYVVTSVRKPDGKIVSKKENLKQYAKFFKIPFIRGIANLIDMLVIGMRSLTWSANQVEEKEEDQLSAKEMFMLISTSLLFAVLIFIIVPFYLTKLMTSSTGTWFNILDGFIRIAVFIIYIYVISLMEDVKVLFQYHGAEHKAVHCYEHSKKLNVDNVKKYTTLHPRCGTAFIGVVLILSIFIFGIVKSPVWYYRLGSRILFIPLIASVSYEVLKQGDKYRQNIFFKILIYPGIYLQKITTKEPNKKQIQVAIDALKKVLNMEAKLSTKAK